MRAMQIKEGRAKRELAELENKERYAVKKLVEANMKKNKEKEGKKPRVGRYYFHT